MGQGNNPVFERDVIGIFFRARMIAAGPVPTPGEPHLQSKQHRQTVDGNGDVRRRVGCRGRSLKTIAEPCAPDLNDGCLTDSNATPHEARAGHVRPGSSHCVVSDTVRNRRSYQ